MLPPTTTHDATVPRTLLSQPSRGSPRRTWSRRGWPPTPVVELPEDREASGEKGWCQTISLVFMHQVKPCHAFPRLETPWLTLKHLDTPYQLFLPYLNTLWIHLDTSCQSLPHFATPCHTLANLVTLCHTPPHLATPCHTFLHLGTPCHTLPHLATLCHTLPHFAKPCNTLPHLATLCNTLTQHWIEHENLPKWMFIQILSIKLIDRTSDVSWCWKWPQPLIENEKLP